jgi:hypothetical protein
LINAHTSHIYFSFAWSVGRSVIVVVVVVVDQLIVVSSNNIVIPVMMGMSGNIVLLIYLAITITTEINGITKAIDIVAVSRPIRVSKTTMKAVDATDIVVVSVVVMIAVIVTVIATIAKKNITIVGIVVAKRFRMVSVVAAAAAAEVVVVAGMCTLVDGHILQLLGPLLTHQRIAIMSSHHHQQIERWSRKRSIGKPLLQQRSMRRLLQQ